MNIGMMQMMSAKTAAPKSPAPVATSSANKSTTTQVDAISAKDSMSKFGSVFDKVISSANQTNQTTPQTEVPDEAGLAELAELLNAESLEELLDLLNIPHDDGLLMLQVGEDGEVIAIDEMLNLEDLMAALNIDAEQLLQVVQQLLGEDQQASDVWELLALVGEQAPLLQAQIVSALQGEEQVTPKEVNQLLQLLKLAELVSQKTDLTAPQENLLTTANNFLTTMQTQIETILTAQQVTTKTTVTLPLHGFQQVVTQAVQTTQQNDTSANEVVTANTVQTKPDTFQVTLPAAKPAQSEALLKEMQAIINKAQISNAQGITRLTMKLYPENLGTIRIELVQNDGVLTARLLASTSHGRELLDSQSQQLKLAFAQQNIQLERLDIAQSLQDADRQQRDQNFFNNFFKQQQQEEPEHKHEEEEETVSFSDYLINEEV